MKKKYSILVTEGPHDQALIARLLQLAGLELFDGSINSLDSFWQGFIPTYPSKRGKLYERMNMPSIITSELFSVAIYWGEGSNLIKNFLAIAFNNKHYVENIEAFGLVIDADTKQPSVIAKRRANDLRKIFPTISEEPGIITKGRPRTGIFVLPDNLRVGTLDTNLVECASLVYPDHKAGAEHFIDSLDKKHTEHLKVPFAKEKAIVSCIVSILKPGAANTPSIAQDKWVCEQTLNDVSGIASLSNFIKNLLEMP